MSSQFASKHHELIGMLYDAILCTEGWQAWLEMLVAATGSRSGLLVLQNADNLDIGYTVQTGFDQSLRELYNREYREHDVWMRRLSHMARETIYPTHAMVPQNEFRHSVIYNEFCRPLDVEHGAGAFLSTGGPWGMRFSLQRTRAQGEFSDADIVLLQQLVPHLRRSLHISRELSHARGNLEASVEHLPVPCILLNNAHQIIAMNSGSRNLIENHRSLAVRQNRLVVLHPEVDRRLKSLIRNCVAGCSGEDMSSGGFVKLPGKERMPLVISVTPFRNNRQAGLWNDNQTVALLFYDPEHKLFPSEQILLEIYGLTRAEARIATLLTMGCRIEEITGKLKVSENTVKCHLKAIFSKTGTHRQSEVVSLLLSRAMDGCGGTHGTVVN
jgi:DNA-binding CsgD family transcriptional regulator/PAS domain-containing protein